MFSRFVVPLLAILSLLAALLPMGAMNPFRAQTNDSLALAYLVLNVAPWLTLGAIALGLVVAWLRLMWGASRLEKAVLVMSLAAIVGSAVLARVNTFERMFSPLVRPGYVAATDATFLESDGLVMGIVVGDQPVAYPVSIVAYHHIVNDRLADEPFVVTY